METTQETNLNETIKETPVDEMDEFLKGYKQNLNIEPEQEQEPQKKRGRGRPKGSTKNKQDDQADNGPVGEVEIGAFISGQILLLFIDTLIPWAITATNNKLTKKKVKMDKLQLSAKQKSDLEPLADAAVKELMLKANPLTIFSVCLLTVYFTNFMIMKGQ